MMIGMMDKIPGLQLQQVINPIRDMADSLEALLLKLLQFLVLHLLLLELLELLVELLVEGVEDGGLEGQGAAADCEDAGGQEFCGEHFRVGL